MAVAADDWYQRRRQDDEGNFFRAVANQDARDGGGDGTDTRQAIYMFTASGKLLACKNAGQNVEAMREVLQHGLKKWRALSESERRPGAVAVGPPRRVDNAYVRKPPPHGLIANVHARALERGEGSETYSDAACVRGAGDEASLDHLWLTEAEWRSLIATEARDGERVPVPIAVAERVLRFHLVDHTRGEPTFWRRDEIRRNDLALIVDRRDANGVDLRLEGSVLLHTGNNSRGYDATVSGKITYASREDRIMRFDIVAIGDHWGAGHHTRRHQRSGRCPLGLAFALADGGPGDAVAPQAARNVREYFGKE